MVDLLAIAPANMAQRSLVLKAEPEPLKAIFHFLKKHCSVAVAVAAWVVIIRMVALPRILVMMAVYNTALPVAQ